MSLNRYATKRDLNERPIVDALRAVGATVVQLDKPVDLLVGFRRAAPRAHGRRRGSGR